MTIEQPQTVLAMIAEDPTVRVYQYQHALTGKTLYALFPGGRWDDMAWAPAVVDPVVLYDAGQYTEAGQHWVARLVIEEETC